MDARQILSSDIDDIIFENRNKDYGAYDIRKKYRDRISVSLLIAIAFVVLVILEPEIAKLFHKTVAEKKVEVVVTTVNKLEAPPPLDNTPPPPPLFVPPPPKTIVFTPPKVVHEEVKDPPPPTIEEIQKTQTSTTTHEGPTILNEQPKELPKEVVKEQPDEIHETFEEAPEFPGGQDAYVKWLVEHINYPAQAIDAQAQGTVYISIVVDINGKVSDVRIKKDPVHYGCGDEAVKAIKNSPPWKPGKIDGKAVKVRYVIPVKFVLPH